MLCWWGLTSPKQLSMHGRHCPSDVAVRMRKVLARQWVGVRVCHLLLLLLLLLYKHFFILCTCLLQRNRSLFGLLLSWSGKGWWGHLHFRLGSTISNKRQKIIQPSCALIKLCNKMLFALIRSVLFEKLLMRISQQQVRPPFWRKNTSSRPLLSRNLSQNTSFSIDFGCSWLRLSQRFKTCFKILRHFVWRKQQSLASCRFDLHETIHVVGLS